MLSQITNKFYQIENVIKDFVPKGDKNKQIDFITLKLNDHTINSGNNMASLDSQRQIENNNNEVIISKESQEAIAKLKHTVDIHEEDLKALKKYLSQNFAGKEKKFENSENQNFNNEINNKIKELENNEKTIFQSISEKAQKQEFELATKKINLEIEKIVKNKFKKKETKNH